MRLSGACDTAYAEPALRPKVHRGHVPVDPNRRTLPMRVPGGLHKRRTNLMGSDQPVISTDRQKGFRRGADIVGGTSAAAPT
jgi:hypothetical protein